MGTSERTVRGRNSYYFGRTHATVRLFLDVWSQSDRSLKLKGSTISVVPWMVLTPICTAQLPPVPKSAEQQAAALPRLFVVERSLDLGVIIEGDKHPLSWKLENHGNADLVIERAKGSCGCVVAMLTDEQKVIPPGGSLELAAEFDSRGRRGRQSKHVMVYSNDPVDPKLKLEFTAELRFLYVVKPPGIANLRFVRRGQAAGATIDFTPGAGRGSLEILDIQVPEGIPLRLAVEPLGSGEIKGQRIRATIGQDAALGTLQTPITVRLSVDGIERERVVTVRVEVVGDLTWHPRIVDQTRSPSRPGKRLAPVTVRSTDTGSFDILETDAGPLFDVVVEPKKRGPARNQYSILVTVRNDATPGPFGTTLSIRTSSLDQPLIRIPVFGIIEPPIRIEPPIILLRADGTDGGTRRRVKLQASPQTRLEVLGIECSDGTVKAVVNQQAARHYHHIRFLDVRYDSSAADRIGGLRESTVTVTTNVPGAERLEIPVVIDFPE